MNALAATARILTFSGPRALSKLEAALDDLHAATGAPVTARRPWLEVWIESYPDYEPWGVAVELHGDRADAGGPSDAAPRLEAVALLARRRRRGFLEVVGLGHGPTDQTRFPARDDASAGLLAAAVAARLRSLRGPWRLRVEQLPVNNRVAAAIVRRLPHAALVPGDGSPRLEFTNGRSLHAYVGRNSRGVAITMRNRIRRAGLELSIDRTRDPARISRELPEIERVHRARDADLVRRSDLDDPRAAAFWRSVIAGLARRGEVELVTLRISGELAGYAVVLLDGSAYRLWDGRFAPEFGWYSPGRLADQAALAAALEDGRFQEFDWMRGEEGYKLRNASDVVPAEHLVAWSSRAVRLISQSPRRAKAALKAARDRNPALHRAWLAVKAQTIVRKGRR